jgi:putative ABC transport system permease protein
MNFMDMLHFSLRGVVRGKARTVLSALAVAIGAASILLISSIGEAGRQAVLTQLEKLGISGLTLYSNSVDSSAQPLTIADADYLNRNIDGVLHAMPLIIKYGEYGLKNWRGSAVAWGIDEYLDSIINLDVLYGRLPSSSEIKYAARVAVIDRGCAEKSTEFAYSVRPLMPSFSSWVSTACLPASPMEEMRRMDAAPIATARAESAVLAFPRTTPCKEK